MTRSKPSLAKSAARIVLLVVGVSIAALFSSALYCTAMPGESWRAPLPPPTSEERRVASELRRHVVELSVGIGERRATHGDSLARAERYLWSELSQVAAGRLRRERIEGSPGDAANLVLDLPGSKPGPLLVVGAHYDSAPGGTPAANDNGSGSAATLVLAQRLAHSARELPLRFVLFANEEQPYFSSPTMGSLLHAQGCKARGEQLRAMFSLETMGYYSDAPGSQKYPPPLSSLYPDRGNFIGFVGNLASRALVRESIGLFRAHARFASEGAALPSALPGVGWSDHWSFWQQGYPAVMITDTAPFRDPNYHQDSDTVDKLDFDKLARVVLGLGAVLTELSRAAPSD